MLTFLHHEGGEALRPDQVSMPTRPSSQPTGSAVTRLRLKALNQELPGPSTGGASASPGHAGAGWTEKAPSPAAPPYQSAGHTDHRATRLFSSRGVGRPLPEPHSPERPPWREGWCHFPNRATGNELLIPREKGSCCPGQPRRRGRSDPSSAGFQEGKPRGCRVTAQKATPQSQRQMCKDSGPTEKGGGDLFRPRRWWGGPVRIPAGGPRPQPEGPGRGRGRVRARVCSPTRTGLKVPSSPLPLPLKVLGPGYLLGR